MIKSAYLCHKWALQAHFPDSFSESYPEVTFIPAAAQRGGEGTAWGDGVLVACT